MPNLWQREVPHVRALSGALDIGYLSGSMKPLLRPMMPELNTLRGLACLAVLCYHGFWWYIPEGATGIERWLAIGTSGGFRGVSLFFVLSGFLITGILLDSMQRLDYFVRFYKRRALRILPAYYLTLILLALYGLQTKAFLFVSLLHIANMAPTLGIAMQYGPLWSLAVEEQFYFLWPMIVRFLNARIVAVLAGSIFVGSVVSWLRLTGSSPAAAFPIWYSAHGLALGALLAIFLRSRFATRGAVERVALGTGILGVWLLIASRWQVQRLPMREMLECGAWDLLFAAGLLGALIGGSSRFESWLRPKPLLLIGEISYGLYLVHSLVFIVYRRIFHPAADLGALLIEFLVCASISILLATVSRFTIEEWFLRLKDRPLWRVRLLAREAMLII